VTEQPERTAQGCRRFGCRGCGKQFNNCTGTVLNRAQLPSDVIALRDGSAVLLSEGSPTAMGFWPPRARPAG
jgi:hypothetical protein